MNIDLLDLLPLLIPLLLVQLSLQITALIHLKKRETVKFDNKLFWVLIIVFGAFLGAISYFIFGGQIDEDGSDD